MMSKNVSLNNDNEKKEEDDSKKSSISDYNQNKNNPFIRNYKNINSLNKMNYDTNHSTNNIIMSLDMKNIDSVSKKENNLTPKLHDLNTFTIQNINKEKENYENNFQNNNFNKNNQKNLITMNFNFDEDQKNFEQEQESENDFNNSENALNNDIIKKNSTYKNFDGEPSWIKELIEISNQKTQKLIDIQSKLYKINIGNSSATGKYKPFTVIGKNEIFANFFKKS